MSRTGLCLPVPCRRATIFFLRSFGPEHLHVAAGKSGIAEPLRHGLRGGGDAAHRIGGVDLDQLFENVVGKLFGGVIDLSKGGEAEDEGEQNYKSGFAMVQRGDLLEGARVRLQSYQKKARAQNGAGGGCDQATGWSPGNNFTIPPHDATNIATAARQCPLFIAIPAPSLTGRAKACPQRL